MQQEIEITITASVCATISTEDLKKLMSFGISLPSEFTLQGMALKEEAEIYGNESTPPMPEGYESKHSGRVKQGDLVLTLTTEGEESWEEPRANNHGLPVADMIAVITPTN